MRVIVVGGGIGGTAAALALLREGIDTVVLEQAPGFTEIGAGLQLSANGVRAVRHLGLEDALAARAVEVQSTEWRRLGDDALLYTIPLGERAERHFGAPYYQAHRADLLGVLAGALPDGVVRFGARVEGFEQHDAGVSVRLADGEELTADVLVGADGLRSATRQALFGADDPEFTELLAWRALIPGARASELDLGHSCFCWFGTDRSVVTYWVRPGELFNFIGFVPSGEVRRESWVQGGDVEELRASFAGSCDVVDAMVGMVDDAFITGVFFRPALRRWSVGRVTLLGDAAHPMTPFLAQGGGTSLEDAVVLARTLARHGEGDVAAGLEEYERRRLPRTARIQAAARAVQRLSHEPDPVQIRARDGRLRGMERIDPLADTVTGWIFGHDPVHAAEAPVDEVRGLAAARVTKRMLRPVAQRACDLFMGAITQEDASGGWLGVRAGHERFLTANFPAGPDVAVTPDDGGLWVGAAEDGPVVLHLHGGGYTMGSAASSVELASRLASAARGRAYVADYRLAPEHPFPAALQDAGAAYRRLLDGGTDPGRIVIAGESAGGALALALVLAARTAGIPLPAGVYAMSPFADLTVSGCTIAAREGDDPVVDRGRLVEMAASYLQGHDPRDPLASPVHADFRGFPPLLLHAASGEALLDDTLRIADRASAAGVDVTLELFDDSFHAFPLVPFLPESERAIAERFAAFVSSLPQRSPGSRA